ncbi:MAG: hypothetical protein ACERKO_10585 [Acetanaerobacterium sp.]
MSNDFINAYITLMIIIAWLALLSPLVWLIISLIPDHLIEQWRAGMQIGANERYAPPRKLKVDRQVYRIEPAAKKQK